MNETVDVIIKSGTLLLVAVSTGLAIRIYYRNKRVELENSLFKSRLEAIGNIQMELAIYLQQLDKTKVILRHIERIDNDKRFELSMKLEEQIYKCEASIVKYAAYFSNDTSEKLIRFAQNFYDQHKGIISEWQEGFDMYEKFINKNAEEVIKYLRKEAGVEEIHTSLMKRFSREKK